MKIDHRGQEYVHLPVTGAPADSATPDVTFDDGNEWHPTTWNADRTSVSILVAGPDMPNPAGVVLPIGRHLPVVRLIDSPETLIRTAAGTVDIV